MPGDGDGMTVNRTPLLCARFAVITVTGPVLAPVGTCAVIDVSVQLLIGAKGTPRNLTEPRAVPKYAPLIVTEPPA
jgi:hypothetical protein